MTLHRARWVLPIVSPPISEGWVAVDSGHIVGLGGGDDAPSLTTASSGVRGAAEQVAILPGLVNAHTHLELSWMQQQVPPAGSVPTWVARLMALRRTVRSEPPAPIVEAIQAVRASGTALVGDVTNTLGAYESLMDSDLSAMIFRELLGFNATEPDQVVAAAGAQLQRLTPIAWLRTSIVPHAPYSASPGLFRAIAEAAGEAPISVHLAESAEEIQFLRDGTGAWRALLEDLGVWAPEWVSPGCTPVEYLGRFGLLDQRLLAVHAVHLAETDLARLAAAGATIVTCPRSNRWTGAGAPPIERFYAAGVHVAIGTDSLASVDDLNMFQELAAVRRLAPRIGAATLLRSATLEGARALGFGSDLGSLEIGKRAELIAVRIPAGTEDVEEYLVGGIAPDDVRWLGKY